VELAGELQRIYDSEINIRISRMWDGGVDLWLGDDLGGYVAHENVSFADVIPWVQQAIAHFYAADRTRRSLRPRSGNRRSTVSFNLRLPASRCIARFAGRRMQHRRSSMR